MGRSRFRAGRPETGLLGLVMTSGGEDGSDDGSWPAEPAVRRRFWYRGAHFGRRRVYVEVAAIYSSVTDGSVRRREGVRSNAMDHESSNVFHIGHLDAGGKVLPPSIL